MIRFLIQFWKPQPALDRKKVQWEEVGGNRVLNYCPNTQHCWDFTAISGEQGVRPDARS